MDYMEAVKMLEEKLVLNEQKHEHGGLVDGKCNGEVVPWSCEAHGKCNGEVVPWTCEAHVPSFLRKFGL